MLRYISAILGGLIATMFALSCGCVPPPDPATLTDHPRSQALSALTEAWWAYDRAPEFDVVHTVVAVPMRDDVAINCRLARPAVDGVAASGTYPGLIAEYTPYALILEGMDFEAEFFAKRGYNVLTCNVRGTGKSQGVWNNAMSSQDGRDVYDLIEWLATQTFSDGRVGQFGESYGGYTSYAAAVEQPPHLLAVAPMQPPGDLYHDVIYPGGIKTTERGSVDSWPPLAEFLSLFRIDADAEYAVNRQHPSYDDYWADHSVAGRHDQIQVPVLTIGGWEDGFFRSGTLSNIEAAPQRTWAIYGQWPHLPPVMLGEPCWCVYEPLPSGVLLAWFDHWVKQLPEVPLPAEPVFISEEGPRGASQGWRDVTWTAEADTEPSYQLSSDGFLLPSATATADMEFQQPREPGEAGGSLTFTTDTFVQDHILLGHSLLEFTARLSADDANFYVELLDVAGDGNETIVNDGFLKASHRNSSINPAPVAAGVAVEYAIPIRADHYRFVAGNRLRIRISGGYQDTLTPIASPVSVTLQTGASARLYLPQGW